MYQVFLVKKPRTFKFIFDVISKVPGRFGIILVKGKTEAVRRQDQEKQARGGL